MHRSFAVLAALIVFIESVAGAVATSERRDFLVKAGLLEPGSTAADKLRETDEFTMEPSRRPGWCFIVDPPSADPYEVYSVHFLPGVPTSLDGDFKGTPPDQAVGGLKTATTRAEGMRPFCFDFQQGDPVGEYRVNVFINGALNTTLRMQMVAPPAPAGTRAGDAGEQK